MKEFTVFEKSIGVTFKDKKILTIAFTHRSYLNENPNTGLEHNERLEFLGDAVLELIVTDFLYAKYKDEPEGMLTSYRAALVNATIIAEIALSLGMNDFLLLSKGEAKDTGKARQYILANTFEALLGAIYLDQGYDTAEKFVKEYLLPRVDEIVSKKLWRDSKSLVQEMAQEHVGVTPSYRVIQESDQIMTNTL
jgi:ribonuclease-3